VPHCPASRAVTYEQAKIIVKRIAQGITTVLALVDMGQASAFEWMNNSVGFRYGQEFTNPKNPEYIAKRIHTYTHIAS
jgi:hypothetical protein